MVEMISNALIIIPDLTADDQVCDFLMQTAQRLAKRNHVYIPVFNQQAQSRTDKYGIHYFKYREILPLRRFALINSLNKLIFMFGLQIYLQIKHFSSSRRYLWKFFPELAELVRFKLPGWQIIFDIVDFHYSPDPKKLRQLKKQKKLLLTKADYIFSISHALQKLYQPLTNKPIKVVPQGFDLQSFKLNSQSTDIEFPQGKPTIGFVGQLSERLDFKLLNELIKNNPQWNFLFVGPVHYEPNVSQKPQPTKIKSLLKHKNFYHFDKQPKNTILSILDQFDVCLIPYDVSSTFNLYSYPMKLFEYFYAGKPVVSTPIEELRNFPQFVFVANKAPDFASTIRSVLIKTWNKNKQHRQQREAIANSWENKLKAIDQYL